MFNLASEAARAIGEAKALHARLTASARAEHRELGPGENQAIATAMRQAQDLKARLDDAKSDDDMVAQVGRLTGGASSTTAVSGGAPYGRRTPGEHVETTAMLEWLRQRRGQLPTGSWTSPSSDLPPLHLMATTLDESSGSGGNLVVPQYVPGILPSVTRPLTTSDLIAPGVTDSNLITFMKETSFTNAAAGVLESGIKPESAMVFAASSEPVRKIAHWIPITEELLEDVPAMRSYIDTRLRLGVQLQEDTDLLNGNGTAPALNGFLVRAGLATAIARGTDTNADAILRQIAALFTSTGLQPDGIVMNPTNWLTVQMLKAADGTYISGGTPMMAPPAPRLWGIPVALTSAIAAGTALVGAFKTAAQIYRKGGIRVEASNSHASFFTTNLIAIRAEERLALVIYRESAFGKVTGLN